VRGYLCCRREVEDIVIKVVQEDSIAYHAWRLKRGDKDSFAYLANKKFEIPETGIRQDIQWWCHGTYGVWL
jgi:hypothetical protein